MSLDEFLSSHSERQILVWSYYFAEKWNKPSLTDHYLMVVACEARRVMSKNPNSIKPEDFRLKFVTHQPETKESAAAKAKARWFALVGAKPKDKKDG
jgi:hypothetical protein